MNEQMIAKFKIEGRMEELEAMSKRKAEAEGIRPGWNKLIELVYRKIIQFFKSFD